MVAGAKHIAGQETAVTTAKGLLGAIILLSIAQATLGQFVAHGVPLFMRAADQPSHIVGLAYIASIPYILKVLWAPVIDRHGNPRFGHYRSWIFVVQLVAFVLLIALSFSDPATKPLQLVGLIVFLATIMATQDACLSGLMVRGLSPEDRARGPTFRAAGAALAGAIVGAFSIYLLADMGWQVVVLALSVFTLGAFGLVCVLRLDKGWPSPGKPPSYLVQFRLFRKTEARWLLLVEVLVGLGLALSFGFKSIVLIDAGFEVGHAALISLVLGSLTGLVSVLGARPLVDRYGGFKVLSCIGFLTALYCAAFGVLFHDGLGHWETGAFVLIASALTFASFPASRSILLGYCAPSRAATDFSAFVTVEGVFLLVAAGIGLMLVDVIGFAALLWVAALGSAVGGVLAWRLRQARESIAHPQQQADIP